MGFFESKRKVNTPRSLEACKREGISNKDLLYKPLEFFQQEGLTSEIVSLYYEFFENKRKALIDNVKLTRNQIINEEKKIFKSRSTNNIFEENKFVDTIKKKKIFEGKNFEKMFYTESKALRDVLYRHKEYLRSVYENEQKIKEKARLDKQKADEKRFNDIKKNKKFEEKLKEDKKIAQEKNKNEEKSKELELIIKEQKSKGRDFLKIKKNLMLKEHLDRMEQYLAKVREEREEKINQKNKIEENRMENLRKNMKTTRIKIRSKSKKNERKRLKMLEKIEKEWETKKNYYQKNFKEIEDRNLQFLQQENEKNTKRYQEKSQERMEKVLSAYQKIQKDIEEKKLKLLQKNEIIQKRMDERQEYYKYELEMKKHRQILKQFNKEWNLKREKKKKEYLNQIIKNKIKNEENRLASLEKFKETQSSIKLNISQYENLKKDMLKEAVYDMSVTKKWNTARISKILLSNSEYNYFQSRLDSLSLPEASSTNQN